MEKKAKPKCKLIGEDGNIFNLWSIANRTLRKNGLKDECEEMGKRIQESKNYSEALMVINEYVEIVGKLEEDNSNNMSM